MDYNQLHGSLGKPLKNIIRVIRKIGFTASTENIIITPEYVVATTNNITREFPTICSWVSNVWGIYLVTTHKLRFDD